ncbi:sulfite exporter TauE/SafE family protein [Malaciobacter marinus]|uniref:Probable membrane transporter protein n=1 Tax=Malaciobacter marinus TaxID=505249 RepID=A0A347TLZ0_9BACT|nr:sulfite exporter TauE/SafE family protein [Malaciobacter marinus]AXX87618.1 sulfite exporter TauE/SafE family protein [Malaciobacter marinus]
MDLDFFIVASIVLIIAAFVHGSIGFGFALIPTPIIAIFTDIQTAILLTLIPTLVVNLVSFLSEGNILDGFKKHMPLALLTMLGSAIGTQLLIMSNSELFKLLLAFIILIYLFVNKVNMSISIFKTYPKSSFVIYSLFTGVVGGLTNVMGPLLMIYGIELKYSKAELIQAMNISFLFGKIIQIVVFLINGSFTSEHLSFSFMAIFIISFSLYLGIKLKKRMDTKVYLKVIRAVLFIISLILIAQVII